MRVWSTTWLSEGKRRGYVASQQHYSYLLIKEMNDMWRLGFQFGMMVSKSQLYELNLGLAVDFEVESLMSELKIYTCYVIEAVACCLRKLKQFFSWSCDCKCIVCLRVCNIWRIGMVMIIVPSGTVYTICKLRWW